MPNIDNFYLNTFTIFKEVAGVPITKPDYISYTPSGEVSSKYWYDTDVLDGSITIIRQSDHWGRVGSCYWVLDRLSGNGLPIEFHRVGMSTLSDFGTIDSIIYLPKGKHYILGGSVYPVIREEDDTKGYHNRVLNNDNGKGQAMYEFVRRGCETPMKLLEDYYLRRHKCFRVHQCVDSQWRPTDVYSLEPLLGDHLRTGHQMYFDATSVKIKDGEVLLEDKYKDGYLYIDPTLLNILK